MLRRLFQRKPRVLPSVEAYALWASRYPAEAHNAFMRLEQEAMVSMLPLMAEKVVLDVACGSGRYANYASQQGANVYACDNSMDMLLVGQVAKSVVATMEYLPYTNASVDVVICGLAIGHLPNVDVAIGEMARVIKQGGYMVVSDVHPYQTQRGASRTFTADDGRTYAVEHYLHTLEHIQQVTNSNGLHLTELREPHYQGNPILLAWQATKL